MLFANLSCRERLLFYLTIAIIAVSLAFNFAVKPLSELWSELSTEVLNKEIVLRKNIKYLNQQGRVSEVYQRHNSFIQKRGSDEEEMSVFLNQVEQQARSSEIHIANIKPKPIKEMDFYKKYTIEMNCQATIGKFIEFIYNLQKSQQLIRVEKLKLTSAGKNNPILKARMLITNVIPAE